MANEFLTQDEVDALLKGVTDDGPDTPSDTGDEGGVRPYDLATQERIVRGRMPTLETINERFARLFRIGIFNLIRRSAELSVGPVVVQKYSEFVRNLVQPTNLNLVSVKPLRGTSLFIFDMNLVFLMIDNLFGGDGRFHTRVEGREFTLTEQRIIQRLLDAALAAYSESWQPVHKLKLDYLRSEMHTQFANIATPNEVVVTTKFTVELGDSAADMFVCVPYATLEPIRDILFSSVQGDSVEPDDRWVNLLTGQVQAAEVELVADLGSTELTLGEIIQLKAGDIVPIEVPDTITACVNGTPVMDCRYGIFDRRYALRVIRMITHSAPRAKSDAVSHE